VLSWLPYVAIALIALFAAVLVFRVGNGDPDWEARWERLTPSDRARITTAVRAGSPLADPEEIQLAAGLARRSIRVDNGAFVPRLILAVGIGASVLIAGVVADNVYLVAFSAVFILPTAWTARRALRTNHNLREAIARGHGH
jgi:hypothetical protein